MTKIIAAATDAAVVSTVAAAKVKTPKVAAPVPTFVKIDGVTYNFASLDDKQADTKITSIKRTGTKLRRDIHETAIGLILHMQEHGRHTKFIALADAIGHSLGLNQRKAFIEWVLAYTWLVENEEKEFSKDKSKKINIVDAMNTPFWTMEKAPTEAPFDFQKAVDQLLKRAQNAVEKGKFQGDETKIDMLKALATPVVAK